MAEVVLKFTPEVSKEDKYIEITKQILSVTEGETNVISKMATVSCLLFHAFDDHIWTGFYLVDGHFNQGAPMDVLVVGPYQGNMGCLRIPFGRGVCGKAIMTSEIQVIDNVHDFPGHIACDSNAISEMVLPVYHKDELIAVMDMDSDKAAMFDDIDQKYLTNILDKVFAK